MTNDNAQAAIALIIQAYKLLDVEPEAFGALLATMANDFKAGNIDKPQAVN